MKPLVLLAALALSGCAALTGSSPSALGSWLVAAQAACDALEPVPPPPAYVATEIASKSALAPGGVSTACEWIRLANVAWKAGQPLPPATPSVARDLGAK